MNAVIQRTKRKIREKKHLNFALHRQSTSNETYYIGKRGYEPRRAQLIEEKRKRSSHSFCIYLDKWYLN